MRIDLVDDGEGAFFIGASGRSSIGALIPMRNELPGAPSASSSVVIQGHSDARSAAGSVGWASVPERRLSQGMTEVLIPAAEEARRYMDKIVGEMVGLFSISSSEAVGRLNRFWQGQEFTSAVKVGVLLHEQAADWAKTIYYGRDSQWWLDEEGLQPQPFP